MKKQAKKKLRREIEEILRHHWAFISAECADMVKDFKTSSKIINNSVYWEDKKSPAEDEYVKQLLSLIQSEKKKAGRKTENRLVKKFQHFLGRYGIYASKEAIKQELEGGR